MDTIVLDKDVKVFYITAKSFPQGIGEATNKLHSLFSFSKDRRIYGLSRLENNDGIVYRAAAEVNGFWAALYKKIVQNHFGKIHAESDVSFARFVVLLPQNQPTIKE